MHALAQGYEYKEVGGKNVLFVKDVLFAGNKQDILKLEQHPVSQPSSDDLVLLPLTNDNDADAEIWQYFLYRNMDNHWEYIASFSGELMLDITLTKDAFLVTEKRDDENVQKVFDIKPIQQLAKRTWVLIER
jgi:hypothetical protein